MKKAIRSVIFLTLMFVPFVSSASVLSFRPQFSGVFEKENLVLEILINTEGKEINAIETGVDFSFDLLEFVNFDKENSIISIWVKEKLSEAGKISLSGGIPGGFKGEGKIGSLTFKTLSKGSGKISFLPGSKILLNDGKGTLDKINFSAADYLITGKSANLPVLESITHPDQNKWYKENYFSIKWSPNPGFLYSYILSQDILAEPDKESEETAEEVNWNDLENGIYYFHLIEKPPDADWSQKLTYYFKIDNLPPENLELKIGQNPSVFEGRYFIAFVAKDSNSGIDRYEINEGSGWKTVQSPHLLKDQSLESKITVKAIDGAGNEVIGEYVPVKKTKSFPLWIITIIILILTAFALKFLKRKKKSVN